MTQNEHESNGGPEPRSDKSNETAQAEESGLGSDSAGGGQRAVCAVYQTLLILGVLLFVVYMIAKGEMGGVAAPDLELTGEDVFGLLVNLFVVALFVERFVEIFSSVIRKPGRVSIEALLRNAKKLDDRHEAILALDRYKAETGTLMLTIAFVIGLIVSLVGVRTLSAFFDANYLGGFQGSLFAAVDVLLTAGILAGGSKGINSMTSAIEAVFTAMKLQSRVTQEKAKEEIGS
jgi:hypothetical protein